MLYFEFVSRGTPTLFVAVPHADPGRIPDGARACCPEWALVGRCETGDGSHTAAFDAGVEAAVTAYGYHLYTDRTAGRTGAPAAPPQQETSRASPRPTAAAGGRPR